MYQFIYEALHDSKLVHVCEGIPFLNKRYIKGLPFLSKWYMKGKGLDLGADPPRIKLC